MKVKTFYAMSSGRLDRQVNEFLAQPGIEVVDVEFGPNTFYFAVMVLYREATGPAV